MNVQDVDAGNWEKEVIASDVLTLVEFWHEKCSWCLRLNPVFEELAEEFRDRIKFTKLNILSKPDSREIAVRYGVMGTPTLMFFCKGRSIETVVGLAAKDRLKETVREMVEKHEQCIEQSTELKT